MASLEFFVPPNPMMRSLWLVHTRLAMPVVSRLMPGGWNEVGAFLGPSISDFCRRYSRRDLSGLWAHAGIDEVQTRLPSFWGSVVTCGREGCPGWRAGLGPGARSRDTGVPSRRGRGSAMGRAADHGRR